MDEYQQIVNLSRYVSLFCKCWEGEGILKKIVSQYYYKSLSRKIISYFLYMAFLMKCEFYHFIIHNTSSGCRKTYPASDWDFLLYWVKVCGMFTLHNVIVLRSLHFGDLFKNEWILCMFLWRKCYVVDIFNKGFRDFLCKEFWWF